MCWQLTDGALSMIWALFPEMVHFLKRENSNEFTTPFFPPGELLVETFGAEMKKILDNDTKIINLIKDQFTWEHLKNCVKIWTETTEICHMHKILWLKRSFVLGEDSCHVMRMLKCSVKKPTWQGTEGTSEIDPPLPVVPSDDCSPSQHHDCYVMRPRARPPS